MFEENAMRETLEEGGHVIGARTRTHSPVLIDAYGELGYDFVWLDFEHGGGSPHDSFHLADLARACEAADIEPLVRLPDCDPALVRKALDAGLSSLLIPRVETAEEARRALAAARYDYDGEPGQRGHAGGRDTGYGARSEGHDELADATALVGVMIESRRAVANLDELLAVPDLGFAFVGPGDLSVSMGHPMEPGHPDVRDTVDSVREACVAADVPVGRPVDATDAAREALDDGFRVVRAGDEVSAARSTLGSRLSTLRDGN